MERTERGNGRRWRRTRRVGGAVPGRGGAAHAGVGRGEPGEDPGCGVRIGGAGGEPGAEAEARRAGDGAGGSQEGVGATAGGRMVCWCVSGFPGTEKHLWFSRLIVISGVLRDIVCVLVINGYTYSVAFIWF